MEQDGHELLLMVFWAVLNPSAKFSLLSQYQLGEGECCMDSVSLHHKKLDGTPGTQSIIFPQDEHLWQFDLCHCLLSLYHTLPDKRSKSLPVSEITPCRKWNPSEYSSFNGDLMPLPDEGLPTVAEGSILACEVSHAGMVRDDGIRNYEFQGKRDCSRILNCH